jgi:predicted DNA binding CopG/RHH family protein
MKKEYNFSKAKVHKGPIVPASKKLQKTIRLDEDVLDWLIQESTKRGIPYQTLLNSILKNAMNSGSIDLEERLSRIEEKLNIKRAG